MKKKRIAIAYQYILLFMLIYSAKAQVISGKVIDETTHQPIPLTYVYLSSGLGTLSNDDGDFIINYKAGNNRDTLFLSHVSFEKKQLVLSDYRDLLIKLTPLTTVLKEVVVHGNDETMKLMNSVYQQIKSTSTTTHFGKGFYRQIIRNNNVPTEIHEIFMDVSYSSNGINKYVSREARFAKKKSTPEKPVISFGNQMQMAVNFFLAPPDKRSFVRPFNDGFIDNIDFYISQELITPTGNFLMISFEPINATNRNSMKGTLIINKANNCVCKFEGKTNSSFGADSVKIGDKKYFVFNHEFNFSYGYDCENKVSSKLIYSDVTSHFESKYGRTEVHSNFFIYETGNKKIKGLKNFDLKAKDLEIIKNTKYHAEFWKTNEIIKRTPLEDKVIASFEKENTFGNYSVEHP